jgi:hypothetical protein
MTQSRQSRAPLGATNAVYVRGDNGELRFHEIGTPTHEEIYDVARWIHERLDRVLKRHGRSTKTLRTTTRPNCSLESNPSLRRATGPRPRTGSCWVMHQGSRLASSRAVREVAKPNDALAEVGGVNVHAGAAGRARNRACAWLDGREYVCR